MAIHVTTSAVDRFGLEGRVSFVGGKIDLPDFAASRRLAELLAGAAEESASAGELNGLARLEEVLQLLVSRHLRERDPGALESLLRGLATSLGEDETERALAIFGADFSLPAARDVLVRELLVWTVLDENPAVGNATRALFAGNFKQDPLSAVVLAAFEAAATDDADEVASGRALLEALRAPARSAPGSLEAQLRFVLERFGDVVGVDQAGFLRGLDLLAEEAKRVDFAAGPGPAEVPAFEELDDEEENYSPDRNWMPSVVLLAKNVYVWLDQMSKRYGRPVERLDQIPDEELDEIAARGFSSLWLIGVWERSAASERLKRMCGNPEAVASAYSLRGYRVAESLGGEDALTDLSRRAGRRGLRLAADMVPNHMGIDSDWLLEHPERFLALSESPFSVYRFEGPDLSPDPRVGIFVEDHYFDRSDAAVVFKRLDRASGETRYVYHGNDGTTMPWNDTAQLDYLNPETREAVIETILEVARRFPVIRFDAAMTLARRHYERLWFPAPGEGGDIPSRAEHGLSPQRFAQLMPREFWREVVDRVAREAPDTLLLAEAFWLMEGYFVRTLGMHRVYNSAFMNMLRDGENAKYRRLIKETLAFDPQILQRYVNFLTNPDEAPAVEQFGDGDRYFGACVLLATLPGLPMFGHGQIEGHGEKYGMEYRRAYRGEEPRREVVVRHEREIVPLLCRRRLFAGVDDFELYDFLGADGEVNENVFVFSNRDGRDRALVLFNNSEAPARGRLGRSAARDSRPGLSLAEGLGLDPDPDRLWVFRDAISGLSFLRSGGGDGGRGWRVEVPAFGYRVCEGFRSASGEERQRYGRLERRLAGAGVADLERALEEIDLEPAALALREILETVAGAGDGDGDGDGEGAHGSPAPSDLSERLATLLRRLEPGRTEPRDRAERSTEPLAQSVAADLETVAGLARLERLEREAGFPRTSRLTAALDSFGGWLSAEGTRPALSILAVLGRLLEDDGVAGGKLARLDLAPILRESLAASGLAGDRLDRLATVVEAAARRGWTRSDALPAAADLAELPRIWSADPDLGPLIGFHRAGESSWVRREDFEDLAAWRLAPAVAAARILPAETQERSETVVGWFDAMETVAERLRAAGYRVDPLSAESSSATNAASE